MSEKPYFSIIAPAVRPAYYEDVYNSISENSNIPFEVVFAGNALPSKTMPDNFRYIYSEKSPACCWEMAARESKGVFLIPSGDDLRFSKNFFNRVYYYTTIFDMDKTLISFRYYMREVKEAIINSLDGIDVVVPEDTLLFCAEMPESPSLGISGAYRKDLWTQLGGLDHRFYGACVDIDITLRFYYEIGMSLFIPPDCLITEVDQLWHKKNRLMGRSVDCGKIRDSFWVQNGIFSRKRLLPFEGFTL
jgi:hypothetical protein